MLGLIFLVWFIPLVLLMMWITKKVYQQFETKWIKRTMGSLTGLFFIAVLWGDTIAGHLYLNYLCTTQGGPHVYQTVELGPEYWNEDGSAKFIYPKGHKRYGSLNTSNLNNQYITKRYDSNIEIAFKIKKSIREIFNTDELILSDYIIFRYRGGWLGSSIGYEVNKTSCEIPRIFFMDLINKTLIKKDIK